MEDDIEAPIIPSVSLWEVPEETVGPAKHKWVIIGRCIPDTIFVLINVVSLILVVFSTNVTSLTNAVETLIQLLSGVVFYGLVFFAFRALLGAVASYFVRDMRGVTRNLFCLGQW